MWAVGLGTGWGVWFRCSLKDLVVVTDVGFIVVFWTWYWLQMLVLPWSVDLVLVAYSFGFAVVCGSRNWLQMLVSL